MLANNYNVCIWRKIKHGMDSELRVREKDIDYHLNFLVHVILS